MKVVNVRITNVEASDESLIEAIAAMLVDGFRQNAPEAFPNLATAANGFGKPDILMAKRLRT